MYMYGGTQEVHVKAYVGFRAAIENRSVTLTPAAACLQPTAYVNTRACYPPY